MSIVGTIGSAPGFSKATRTLGPSQTVGTQTVTAVSMPVSEGRVFHAHVVLIGQSDTASGALMFLGDYVVRRPVGGNVVLACNRSQVDQDFANPPPSVAVSVNTTTQTLDVKMTGKSGVTVTWLGSIDSFRMVS